MPSHVEDMLLGPFSHRLAARWSSLTSQGTLQWEHLFIGFAGGDVYDRKRLRGSDGKEHGLHSSLHIVGTQEYTDRMEGTEHDYSDVLCLEEKCVCDNVCSCWNKACLKWI